MVDLANKRCAHQGCTKRASHGKAGGKVEYCRDHAEDGMENVKDKRCIHHGCTKGPSYGKVGGRAEYCKEHAEDGMESVVSKKCAHHGCTKGPSYGKAGGKAEYCKEHAEDGMEKRRQQEVRSKPAVRRGRRWPGQHPRFCGTHAEPGMVSGGTWSNMPEEERQEQEARRKDLEAAMALRVAAQRKYIGTGRQARDELLNEAPRPTAECWRGTTSP